MTILKDFPPRYRKPRRRLNRASGSKYSIAAQFPTVAERERQKALERAKSQRRDSALAEIHCVRAKLKDPGAPPADSSRLIAVRMASVIEEMQHVTSSIELRALQAELKDLRTMAKVLLDAHRCQRRDQELDIEGPKFQAALKFLCNLFSRTLTEANLDKGLVKALFVRFRDLADAELANLRRAVDEA